MGAVALALAWAGLLGAPPVALAAPASVPLIVHLALAAPVPSAEEARLAAECADLRAQLDRKTAEISALKRGERGVRQDYDLRQRMAEANELARRLTALESQVSQLAARQAPTGKPAAPAGSTEPVEGAAALAARADLLSDEAHKLSERAAGMIRAAGQMRTRQALRRKAANVERDPFASLDGAKRLMIARPGATPTANGDRKTGLASGSPESTTGGAGSAPGNSTPSPPPGNTPMPAVAPVAPGSTPTSSPPATTSTPPAQTPTPVSDSKGAPSPTANPAAAPGRTELAPGGLLDPALNAELSRMNLGSAGGATQPETLEQAAAALVSRAQALETQAKALRAKAASR
jgi:hypothetical protein